MLGDLAKKYPKIEGLCVTRNTMHYHIKSSDQQTKDWYLNGFWEVSNGHCHKKSQIVTPGKPLTDWIDD